MNSRIRDINKLYWYVMRCHDAEEIEACIDQYNAREDVTENDKIDDFFIPLLAIRKRVVDRSRDIWENDVLRHQADENRKNNELRNTLRKFVFLHARPSVFDGQEHHLPAQKWNIGLTRLYHYRDALGHEITIDDQKMNTFISGCLEYLEHFEIRTKDSRITEGLQVTVREGAFRNFKAEVCNIHYKGDGIRFSIAIRFFANDKYIYIHDRKPEDVMIDEQDAVLFSADFISRIQADILDILSRRVNKKETPKSIKDDGRHLRQLYYLRHAIIDDTLRSVQLDALMSICASLARNAHEKTKYNRVVKQRLKMLDQQFPNDQTRLLTARAYLLTALCISTKDPEYRNQLKVIVRQQMPENQPLNKFFSLIKKM